LEGEKIAVGKGKKYHQQQDETNRIDGVKRIVERPIE